MHDLAVQLRLAKFFTKICMLCTKMCMLCTKILVLFCVNTAAEPEMDMHLQKLATRTHIHAQMHMCMRWKVERDRKKTNH